MKKVNTLLNKFSSNLIVLLCSFRMYTSIEPLQKTIQEIQDFISYKNFQPALDRLTEIVEHIPWDAKLREMRADAYLGVGNTMNAISEMRAMTKLTNDNTDGYFKLATMHYQLGKTLL